MKHIYWEYENFGEDKEKQQELGAFYTPKVLIEKMYKNVSEFKDKTFYDPTFGYGALLGFALDKKLDAGEDVNKAITEVYGCELDPNVYAKGLEKLENWARKNGANEESIAKMKSHFVNMDTLQFDPSRYWMQNDKVNPFAKIKSYS